MKEIKKRKTAKRKASTAGKKIGTLYIKYSATPIRKKITKKKGK